MQKHGHRKQAEARSHRALDHGDPNLDLNSATLQELSGLMGIERELAQIIISARPIHSWTDIEALPGFDRGLVDELKRAGATIDFEVF